MLGLSARAKGWITAAGLLVSVFMAGALSAAAILQFVGTGIEAPERDHRRDGRDGRPSRRGPPSPDGRFGGPGGDREGFFLDMLTERLELDPSQRERVAEILGRRERIANDVMRSVRDQLKATMDSLDAEVRQVLDAEQQETFDQLQQEGRDRLGRRFPGAGGPPDRGRPPP